MKIIGLEDSLAEQVDRIVNRHKLEFRSRSNFVTQAVVEKIEREKELKYTEKNFSDLLRKFPSNVSDFILNLIPSAGNQKNFIRDLMDFLIDAEEVSVIEGEKEDLSQQINQVLKTKKNLTVTGVYLFLRIPAEKKFTEVVDFLATLDKSLPEGIDRRFSEIFIEGVDKYSGQILLTYRRNETNDSSSREIKKQEEKKESDKEKNI